MIVIVTIAIIFVNLQDVHQLVSENIYWFLVLMKTYRDESDVVWGSQGLPV